MGAGGGPMTLPPNLPAGVPLPPGVGATDAITQTLATLPPNQLLDIMSQMKSLVTTSPDQRGLFSLGTRNLPMRSSRRCS